MPDAFPTLKLPFVFPVASQAFRDEAGFGMNNVSFISIQIISTIYEDDTSLVRRQFITNVWHSIARTWSKKTTKRVAGHW